MQVGYARVSSVGQSLAVQLERLQHCEKIYQEKQSGTNAKREQLQACLEFVRQGDTLMVTKLDRLARSMLHLCSIAETLANKGVQLEVLDQALETHSPTGKLLFHVLAAIAEFETALRKERQMEGIAHAKAKGVHFGSKPTLTSLQVAELSQKRQAGVLIKELMREYHLGKSSIYRYLAQGHGLQTTLDAAD